MSLIFDNDIYSTTLGFPPDSMGSKDAPMYEYVCVQALLLERKLHDASALLYLITFTF